MAAPNTQALAAEALLSRCRDGCGVAGVWKHTRRIERDGVRGRLHVPRSCTLDPKIDSNGCNAENNHHEQRSQRDDRALFIAIER
ncbi:hypothetical protein [Aeromicrobium alkaliterrae]|uniref:Uncharacterized protein n=1 Tax=Aeromicrobium alkaliterrae TaxID=302168 RepID=A0ABP4VVX4_9ACTN